MLREFLQEYNSFYDKNVTIKAPNLLYLNTFKDEVNFVIDKFFACDDKAFGNISLCKKLDLDNLNLSSSRLSLWGYLHNLYIMTLEATDKSPVVERSKISLEALKSSMETKVAVAKPNVGNTDLNALIAEIAEKVSGKLDGKNLDGLDPMEIMNKFMSGSSDININGIDFSDILKSTTASIEEKVKSGQLNIDALKSQTMDMLGSIQK
jgi:hypothetical protein